RARRDDRAAPGRTQPGAPAGLLHDARPGDAPALPAGDAPLLHRLRDPDDRAGEPPHGGRRARPALGGRAADAPGGRGRGAFRTRPDADRAQEGRSLCLARGPPRGPPARLQVTATMMYGHVEQPDDLLDHLDAIRELQDEWGGFTAF